jgi:dihydrofolate reductase
MMDRISGAGPYELLLGRGTYEIFAAHWPHDEGPIADHLNRTRKHVASRTLERADWNNSTLIDGAVAEYVAALKAQDGPEIQVHGSPGLIQTLLQHDLVDEYRLWIFPVVLGRGKRFFGDGTIPVALKLADSRATKTGVTVNTYGRAGAVGPDRSSSRSRPRPSSSGAAGSKRADGRPGRLAAGRDLLHGPAVAVRVAEEDEADVVERIGLRGEVLAHHLDLADLHPSPSELGMGRPDVRDHELQALERARCHVRDDPLTDDDRAARSGRGELDDPVALAHRGVVVDVEAELLGVEGLRAVHVRDGDDHHFESPVHEMAPVPSGRAGGTETA